MAKGFPQIEGVVYDETLDLVSPIHFHPNYHPWVGNHIIWMDSWWVGFQQEFCWSKPTLLHCWWLIQKALFLDTSKPWLIISRWRIWIWCTTSWDKKYDRGLMRLFLSQGKYTKGILKKFSMTECKSMSTPMVMDLTKNKWWWFRRDWSTCVPTTDWIIDVSG